MTRFYSDIGKRPPSTEMEQYLTFSSALFLLGGLATVCDVGIALRGRRVSLVTLPILRVPHLTASRRGSDQGLQKVH
jgi:hypothetical protein